MSVQGVSGALVLAGFLVACGSVANSPDSAGSAGSAVSQAGSAPSAAGGSGGSQAAMGGATGLGSAGADPLPALHSCLEIANEAPCPERVLTASIHPTGSSDLGPASLEGVTDLDGDLVIDDQTSGVLSTLGCLRRVSGEVSIETDDVTSLWPLRNLEEVAYNVTGAGLQLRGAALRQDCGLLKLQRIGTEIEAHRGAGIDLEGTGMTAFELPALERIYAFRIQRNSQLSRIRLPSALVLLDGQFWIKDNPALTTLAGLESATLSLVSDHFGTLPQYQFQNNPLLPNCTAENVRQRLVGLGADPASFVIDGNASTCPN